MVSNLLTVCTSEQATTPIVNVGTLNRERSARGVAQRKRFLLRIDPALYDAVERWVAMSSAA